MVRLATDCLLAVRNADTITARRGPAQRQMLEIGVVTAEVSLPEIDRQCHERQKQLFYSASISEHQVSSVCWSIGAARC